MWSPYLLKCLEYDDISDMFFVLCSKCVYFVVFTREMIVYVCMYSGLSASFLSMLVIVCA